MALGYPAAQPPKPLEVGPLTVPWVDAREIYEQRWVFHGPQYQAVAALTELGTEGIRGVIKSLPAPGALLDAATQVAAMWCMLHVTDNRPVLPYRADAIRFYRPHPPVGTLWSCDVRPLELTDERYRCDIVIYDAESIWARIEGWEDRRFEINDRLFAVSKFPEHHLSAEIRPDGFAILEQSWRTAATRYLIARRYLDRAELDQYQALSANIQPQWLLGRMVLKDAVRAHLRKGEEDLLFPIQIHVDNEPTGRPIVRGPWAGELRVSVAHKPGIAVAIVAEGQDVGIDIERIEPRSQDFIRSAFTESELDLLPRDDRETWLTRLWVGKEAVAKASGLGIPGNVLKLRLEALDGTRLCINGAWVETRREGAFIVGWTNDVSAGRQITISTPA
jgi:phosphopantetheinyl transferase